MTDVTFVDNCLVEVAVAEARPPPDEYPTDSDFFDREDEADTALTVSISRRPIRAHFRLDL